MAMNEEIDYVNELQNALQELADKENIEMIFTNANGSAEKQLSDIDSLIVQKPDVIVIRVVDPDSGVSCVEAVKNAGIPCVIRKWRDGRDSISKRYQSSRGYITGFQRLDRR